MRQELYVKLNFFATLAALAALATLLYKQHKGDRFMNQAVKHLKDSLAKLQQTCGDLAQKLRDEPDDSDIEEVASGLDKMNSDLGSLVTHTTTQVEPAVNASVSATSAPSQASPATTATGVSGVTSPGEQEPQQPQPSSASSPGIATTNESAFGAPPQQSSAPPASQQPATAVSESDSTQTGGASGSPDPTRQPL